MPKGRELYGDRVPIVLIGNYMGKWNRRSL
nr:MAG TPA: hypothetical protein [Caudoviricetes sp.]